jgi:hypothetical membrane protein
MRSVPVGMQGTLKLLGILGPAILAIGVIVPAVAYVGRAGEDYSPLNHFISELGEVGVSPLAWLFNGSLVASGVLMAAFLAGMGWRLGTRLGRAAALAGVVAGLGSSAVGLIPMNDLQPHLRAAFTFFDGGLVAVGLFTVAVLRDRRGCLPRWLVLPGLATGLAFAAFLAWPWLVGAPDLRVMDPLSGVPRPAAWGIAILEWAVLITVVGFITCAAAAVGPPFRNQCLDDSDAVSGS